MLSERDDSVFCESGDGPVAFHLVSVSEEAPQLADNRH
jgi:hypothetical protein